MPCNIRPAHFLATTIPGAAGALAILVNISMPAKMGANEGGSTLQEGGTPHTYFTGVVRHWSGKWEELKVATGCEHRLDLTAKVCRIVCQKH